MDPTDWVVWFHLTKKAEPTRPAFFMFPETKKLFPDITDVLGFLLDVRKRVSGR
jgi:hypothetical protein